MDINFTPNLSTRKGAAANSDCIWWNDSIIGGMLRDEKMSELTGYLNININTTAETLRPSTMWSSFFSKQLFYVGKCPNDRLQAHYKAPTIAVVLSSNADVLVLVTLLMVVFPSVAVYAVTVDSDKCSMPCSHHQNCLGPQIL